MKPITIIKNRSDIGAGTRGSDLGVDAIEIAAINQQNSFFNEQPTRSTVWCILGPPYQPALLSRSGLPVLPD